MCPCFTGADAYGAALRLKVCCAGAVGLCGVLGAPAAFRLSSGVLGALSTLLLLAGPAPGEHGALVAGLLLSTPIAERGGELFVLLCDACVVAVRELLASALELAPFPELAVLLRALVLFVGAAWPPLE